MDVAVTKQISDRLDNQSIFGETTGIPISIPANKVERAGTNVNTRARKMLTCEHNTLRKETVLNTLMKLKDETNNATFGAYDGPVVGNVQGLQ